MLHSVQKCFSKDPPSLPQMQCSITLQTIKKNFFLTKKINYLLFCIFTDRNTAVCIFLTASIPRKIQEILILKLFNFFGRIMLKQFCIKFLFLLLRYMKNEQHRIQMN